MNYYQSRILLDKFGKYSNFRNFTNILYPVNAYDLNDFFMSAMYGGCDPYRAEQN